jgi:hypothetical protein
MALYAKRYIELVNPEELDLESRDYKATTAELIEMYDLDDLHVIDECVYYDDENDLFWIRKDDNGYYVETYQYEREFEIADTHELIVVCESNLHEITPNFFALIKPEDVAEEDFDDTVFLVVEK